MNIKFSFFKKRYLIIFLLTILFVFAYWVKVQIGINFSNSFSIGSYFPFKYLMNNVIVSPKPGILIEENFDEKRVFKIWSLQIQKAGTVNKELSLDGVNGSKCLLIKNIGRGYWVYYHRKIIEVNKGDIFHFEGDVNIQGDDLSVFLSLTVLDKNKNVINWNLFKEKVNRRGVWIRVEKQFIISDDVIKYIRFRLVGVDKGDFRCDNIIIRKIK